MDDLTSAVTLVHHDSESRAEEWFEAICTLYDELGDSDHLWDEFRERWPAAAADRGFSGDVAEDWVRRVEDLTHDPAALLRELAERRTDLGQLYESEAAAATAQQPTEADASAAGRFGWLLEDATLVGRVEKAFRYQPEHYDEYLGPYLDQYWGGGWEQNPDDHKRAWLDQMLSGMETMTDAPADPTASTPAEAAATAQGAGNAAATSTAAEPADPAAEELGQAVADVLAEAMAQVPGAADLPPEVLQQVLAEALASAQPAAQ